MVGAVSPLPLYVMGRKALQLVSVTIPVVRVEHPITGKLISITPSSLSLGNAHVVDFLGFGIGFGLSFCLELGPL